MLGIAASVAGLVIGYAVQMLVAATLEGLMRASLPLPSPIPALQGIAVGLVLLLGFALPPLLQLKNVPAGARHATRVGCAARRRARRVRRRTGNPRRASHLAGGRLRLGVIVVGSFSAALAAFFLVAWVR
jgi:putative ABC transport system permease protein